MPQPPADRHRPLALVALVGLPMGILPLRNLEELTNPQLRDQEGRDDL